MAKALTVLSMVSLNYHHSFSTSIPQIGFAGKMEMRSSSHVSLSPIQDRTHNDGVGAFPAFCKRKPIPAEVPGIFLEQPGVGRSAGVHQRRRVCPPGIPGSWETARPDRNLGGTRYAGTENLADGWRLRGSNIRLLLKPGCQPSPTPSLSDL
jgi:hypothetical protein